jgi:hypothetical protein
MILFIIIIIIITFIFIYIVRYKDKQTFTDNEIVSNVKKKSHKSNEKLNFKWIDHIQNSTVDLNNKNTEFYSPTITIQDESALDASEMYSNYIKNNVPGIDDDTFDAKIALHSVYHGQKLRNMHDSMANQIKLDKKKLFEVELADNEARNPLEEQLNYTPAWEKPIKPRVPL